MSRRSPCTRLPDGSGLRLRERWGTPVLTPLMKDIDNGGTAPIQGR
jgi:hypothetical protein